MKKEWEEILFERHPDWFKNKGDLQQSLMSFGFPDDGWFSIIDELMNRIAEVVADSDEFQVVQVKEKFGTLRFYFNLKSNDFKFRFPRWFNRWNKYKLQSWCDGIRKKLNILTRWEKIHELVSQAESKTDCTCEVCGLPGKVRGGRWLKCLCDNHSEGRNEFEWPTIQSV